VPDGYHRFNDRVALRRWLELNHAQDEAIWVVLQKVKSTKDRRIKQVVGRAEANKKPGVDM